MKNVIDELQSGADFFHMFWYVLFIFALHLSTELLNKVYNNFYLFKADTNINRKLQKEFYDRIFELDLECFETPDFYNKYVQTSVTFTSKVHEVLANFCGFVSSIISFTTISFYVFSISPVFILIGFLPFLFNLFFGNIFNKISYQQRIESIPIGRNLDYIHRTFYLPDFAKEIRTSNVSNILLDKFSKYTKQNEHQVKKFFPRFFAYFGGESFVRVFTTISAMAYAAYLTVVSKTMSLGDFYVVSSSIASISTILSSFVSLYNTLAGNSMYIEDVRYFFEHKVSVEPNPEGLKAPKKDVSIEVNNLSFRYISQTTDCLKNISFKIAPGEKIAIVGNNGAGKSTLVKLLMRLYNASSGEILLNGINIKEYSLQSLWDTYGTVFQDYRVLAFSIAENVLMKPNLSEMERDKIIKALDCSGFSERLKSIPMGIDANISREFDENGVMLSGGEIQKIALARVFAKECGIIVLDEPSSALDPIAEHEMYENMMAACEDKTVIFISHRLSATVMADRILLLENGEIIESGSHEELMALNGKYAYMFQLQAEQYMSEEGLN